MADGGSPLDAEDTKLVTLARAARVRAGAAEGAAVRDDIGRTYAAGSVTLPSLQLTALQATVAAAASSGAGRIEAVVVHSSSARLTSVDAELMADVAPDTVLLAGVDGSVVRVR